MQAVRPVVAAVSKLAAQLMHEVLPAIPPLLAAVFTGQAVVPPRHAETLSSGVRSCVCLSGPRQARQHVPTQKSAVPWDVVPAVHAVAANNRTVRP